MDGWSEWEICTVYIYMYLEFLPNQTKKKEKKKKEKKNLSVASQKGAIPPRLWSSLYLGTYLYTSAYTVLLSTRHEPHGRVGGWVGCFGR